MKKLFSEISAAAKNFFKFIVILVIDFIIKRKKVDRKEGTLLLIRLDAIGDYIIFRNFISILKNDAMYKNYKITLCGNISWKNLAETFDKDVVNNFIWIDRMKYLNSLPYRYKIMTRIYESGFETAIETIHSREILFGDSIIKASNARVKIGSRNFEKYSKLKKGIFTDSFYTKLLPVSDDVQFEFNRTKNFFTHLLGYEIELKKPFLDTSEIPKPSETEKNYIMLFPGVSRKDRMWNAGNFKIVADYIFNNYPFDIVVSGSEKEKEIAQSVCPEGMEKRFINLSGNTLPELAKIISDAELLISNETSAVHFAAAVDTPFICIVNGFYAGRFYPYPEDVFSKAYYIYPEDFNPGESKNINSISPEKVIALIKEILK